MTRTITKRDGRIVPFDDFRIYSATSKAISATKGTFNSAEEKIAELITSKVVKQLPEHMSVEDIQNLIIKMLRNYHYDDIAKCFESYKDQRNSIRDQKRLEAKNKFIYEYSNAENAATGSIYDSNANVAAKNIATLNAEIPKQDAIKLNRYRVVQMLTQLYGNSAPDYEKDLNDHIIYKNDENSFSFGTAPYCVAINCYPFLQNGLKDLGGLSAAPKNLDSFCGMFVNLIFAVSSQFAGAVAVASFFNMFDYFARKEWGDDYFLHSLDRVARLKQMDGCEIGISVEKQIEQYFQQIVYSINQPAGNRSFQSPFTNISYFDKNYWQGMFGHFFYPDGTQPQWDSINWLQKKFMKWFNQERSKCVLTFPVETVALLSDGKDKILDSEWADFVAEMYAEGHSFFTYISDNVDSLSSCCRLRNELSDNTFNFTNGLTGEATGSKSVITLNINRIVQDWAKTHSRNSFPTEFPSYLETILDRVYKYHTAYNELLKELYNSNMLPVYKAGFISMKQQYLTIGVNGINEAAEYMGIEISDNKDYENFINTTLRTISRENIKHKTQELIFNTEFVPGESLGVKNAKWDKEDGYFSPRDCYNSYFFLPESNINIIEKFKLHGKRYVSNLDGGSALHCNLEEHLSKNQYAKLLQIAVKEGTNYFTFNIKNTVCRDCGYISKHTLDICPKCKSRNVDYATRIIGYLRLISNFSKPRQQEAFKRFYGNMNIDA